MLALIGTLPTLSGPVVILIYVVLILMLGSALASVLLRDVLYAVGAFAATMLLVALLYLTIAPVLLFAVQLLVYTTVSAALLVGLLRVTTGLERTTVGPFSREWIAGASISAAFLALLGVVLAATSWPARAGPESIMCCPSLGAAVTNDFAVGFATVIVLLASAALGAGLMLVQRATPAIKSGEKPTVRGRGRR